ncbi:DUF6461 domain-containing protein [Streptomyces californicus]|uniref:DUF6461 domain-containing protein n=1 Tax=Streptomyces californicus TaxID=67351 RepID=UPI0036C48155
MHDSTDGPWDWADLRGTVMFCVTMARGITPEDVLSRYGADAGTARLLTSSQAGELGGRLLPTESLLTAGALNGWSFCSEEYGIMGSTPGPLAALSRGTEAFSLLRGADGMNVFAHWRDGRRTEQFEPGYPSTEPRAPHPWWDAVQERLDASGKEYPGLAPVLEAVARRAGADLDSAALRRPRLTVRLDESARTPDPPTPVPSTRAPRPTGRRLGRLLPGAPPPEAVRSELAVRGTTHPYGTRVAWEPAPGLDGEAIRSADAD